MSFSELKKILSMYNSIEDKKHLVLVITSPNPNPLITLEALLVVLRDFIHRCVDANSKECPQIDYDKLREEIEYIANYIDYNDPQILQILEEQSE